MPKKLTKLTDLFSEIDKDHLCDILLALAQSNIEIENRIRTLIAPKSQLDNPTVFYKKLIKKLPNKIKNASDRKLLTEGLKPLLTQIKDLQNIRNYTEANKPLTIMLEIVVSKLAKSSLKGMQTDLQNTTMSWCQNIDNIPNSELQFKALQDILMLETSKELQLESEVMGYFITKDGLVPNYSNTNQIHPDFYQLLLQLSRFLESKNILEDLRQYLVNHKNSKQFELPLLNISQELDSENVFVKKATKNLDDRESAILLKNFYYNKGEISQAMDIMFRHIELNKNYFTFKSGEAYISALEFVAIYKEHPDSCNIENYCQVLVYLISAGDINTAQDVSISAKWYGFFEELIKVSGDEFGSYYKQIVDILSRKYLSKTLSKIGLIMKDKEILSKNINYIEIWEDAVEACEIIAKDYPDQSLKRLAKLISGSLSEYSNSFFGFNEDFREVFKQERIISLLTTIRLNITELSHKKIDNMIIKVNKCYKLTPQFQV